jgi:peptide chain release factor 1
MSAAEELAAESSGAERDSWRAEAAAAGAKVEHLEEALKLLLLPADPNDGKNVILEIRGAEGGEEANLFAHDLFEMYRAYAQRRGWQVEVLQYDASDMGGVNQVTALVKGEDAWSRLKFEGGPHRVQRVPVTESQGRIHTSSATVTVLPEAEEVDVDVDERDLQIDVYRASGPGGQGVNTTDSAVRITHVPTGIVVAMQDERSQLQNRARAMQVLRARLLRAKQEEADARLSAERRAQVGGGGRSEKIRTYNYKENRITDHRIGFTLYQLQAALAGDLDPVVDALSADLRARQLLGEQ